MTYGQMTALNIIVSYYFNNVNVFALQLSYWMWWL